MYIIQSIRHLSFILYKQTNNSGLSVCTGKNYTIANYEKQSALCLVPTIQTVKGQVVFFRKEREKISTLKPLTVWIFAVAISPPKTENRILQPCPRFRPLHSNLRHCRRENPQGRGLYYLPTKTASNRPQARFAPLFLPVSRRAEKFCVNNSKKHLTKRFMGDSERH